MPSRRYFQVLSAAAALGLGVFAVAEPTQAVKLVEAGAEPRQVQRLQATVGDRAAIKVESTFTTSVEGDIPPQAFPQMPSMMQTLEWTVTEVALNGDIRFDSTVLDADVAKSSGPDVWKVMRESQQDRIGTRWPYVCTSQGWIQRVPHEATAEAWSRERAVDAHVPVRFTSPLPTEPVGIGAVWQVEAESNINGLVIKEVTTYTLRSLVDDVMEIDVKIEGKADDAVLCAPKAIGGAMRFKSFATTGSGFIRQSLKQLAPLQLRTEQVTVSETEMTVQGKQKALRSEMRQVLTVERVPDKE